MLQPGASKTFNEYSLDAFIPFIKYQMQNVNRLDIVWNRYFANSLKINTGKNRGAGVRRKVTSSGPMPKNWKSFLRCSENKIELFEYLSEEVVMAIKGPGTLVATYNDLVISNQQLEKLDIEPCGIEEADKTHQNLLIKTVDSDVVVIALAVFQEISNLKELWIRYLPIHELSLGLGVIPTIMTKGPISKIDFFSFIDFCLTNLVL